MSIILTTSAVNAESAFKQMLQSIKAFHQENNTDAYKQMLAFKNQLNLKLWPKLRRVKIDGQSNLITRVEYSDNTTELVA